MKFEGGELVFEHWNLDTPQRPSFRITLDDGSVTPTLGMEATGFRDDALITGTTSVNVESSPFASLPFSS